MGINYSDVGAVNITIDAVTISLSGLAVGSIVGIILNAILPGKDYDFDTREAEGSLAAAGTIQAEALGKSTTRE